MKKQNSHNLKLIAYTDGGARGNPGPAAIGVVVHDPSALMPREYGEYIGETTNNVAEYKAVLFALKKIKQLFGKEKAKEMEIEVRLDSELIERQLNGQYKIEEESLRELFVDVWNARLDFKSVSFVHIPREKNKKADALVNKALDAR